MVVVVAAAAAGCAGAARAKGPREEWLLEVEAAVVRIEGVD